MAWFTGKRNEGQKQKRSVALFGNSHKKRKCDGDCDNCPAHYGYRYGRWYYGHAHQRGCEFGGNGGLTGKCHKN